MRLRTAFALALLALVCVPALAQAQQIDITMPGGVMKVVSVTITAAQVLTLDTVPVVIIPDEAGAGYIPWAMSVHKPAGTAYANIAAGDDLQLQNTAGANYLQIETTGFLDQATAQSIVTRTGAGTLTNALVGLGMQIKLLGPVDTGDSPLIVKVVYWKSTPATP